MSKIEKLVQIVSALALDSTTSPDYAPSKSIQDLADQTKDRGVAAFVGFAITVDPESGEVGVIMSVDGESRVLQLAGATINGLMLEESKARGLCLCDGCRLEALNEGVHLMEEQAIQVAETVAQATKH